MRARLHPWLSVAAGLLLGVTVAGSCGAWHWLLDLAGHFRAYWLVAAAVGLVLALRRPRSIALVCCALALAGNVWAMLPFWLPGPPLLASATAAEPIAATTPPLSLILTNVHRLNPDRSLAVAYLRDRRPDVAVVIEIDAAWAANLSSLDELYPFRVVEPRDDNFGIAVLSRWPLIQPEVVTFGGTPFPSITATVRFHDRDVRLIATHPHPPFSAARAAALLGQLGAVADAAAAAVGPRIVAGDFNATPWSLAYRTFAARSGLRDTALGRGVQPTWNARRPAPRIPIDHVFASPDLAVVRRAIGPDIGSDHFPVEVTLVLPPAD
jgi:endonuclease/exonuclease/phosphatase (EEP) superfamily protein YafD